MNQRMTGLGRLKKDARDGQTRPQGSALGLKTAPFLARVSHEGVKRIRQSGVPVDNVKKLKQHANN